MKAHPLSSLRPTQQVPFRTQQEQPGGGGGASPLLQQATRANPFALPKTYLIALQHKVCGWVPFVF
ncbi:unnamed protein product, partial [Closterium sp. NIES-54]